MAKRIRTPIIIACLLLSLICLFVSCKASDDADKREVKVILAADEGVEALGELVVKIPEGSDATFAIRLGEGYVLKELSHGKLLNKDGEVTDGYADKEVTVLIPAIEKDTVVKLFTEDIGFSTIGTFYYGNNLTGNDESSHATKNFYNFGTEITLSARDETRNFIGWSIGKAAIESEELISKEREVSYRVRPEDADDNGAVKIYANYLDKNTFFYDAGEGNIDFSSVLATSCEYYKATPKYGKLMITYTDEYLDVFACPPLFYDDGTFTKGGSVLTEFNTKADGSGEGYGFGSRFYLDRDSQEPVIFYPIYKRASNAGDFETEEYYRECPTESAKASFWESEGLIITAYLGNDREIVIPETINGKRITAIASGAFCDKDAETLVIPRFVHTVENGAFSGFRFLKTIYYPDSIYDINDKSFDETSLSRLKNLYVNATMEPRYANTANGAFSVKLSRLMTPTEKERVIVLGGSSVYQGLSSAYMEALFGGKIKVINFGTTRTTNGIIYLEGMSKLAKEGDTVLFAPENSTYMMGESELYWKTLSDLESMYNFWRCIDASEYENIFGAFSDFNKNYRYERTPRRYEDSYKVIVEKGNIDSYGEYQHKNRVGLSEAYVDSYYITMNNRYKSKYDLNWNDEAGQLDSKDYTDPNNKTWESIDSPRLVSNMNRAISRARLSGASVYFSFCPVDADKLVDEAKNVEWLTAYDELLSGLYSFDGVLGSCMDYIYAHKYVYDCAFHLNDIGRTYRTYQLYSDLTELFGIEKVSFTSSGTSFQGCIFDDGGKISEDGLPITKVDYLNN
ncbi:MAG: leucine-rich repeat protein [Clostridia bacterium]|nr:leucine-rich repeat protein [Clostridia bacterium]